ncbi:membrane protein [Thalassotalea loyana]|uniref:Membrane protein n=1 Tax=Thalassotalea loyana TaxID=280483 RepID=A0ABQ6H8Q6_9GAMM|nr:RodZ domain-containing protein [Thalassotalea loyana]GLX84483.1 membrane protein [Thalassotalea loyana]
MSEVTEITEDIEVIGPGRLLGDARKAKGLSVEDVAEKLNFRIGLVKEIEADEFDRSLPSTFNRGYLKNYAKLVEIPEEDVLSSFEMLGVAEKQSTEMQSFSKITEKQAQTRSLMWLSYLILAVLVGSTLVWFYQYQKDIAEKSVEIDSQREANEQGVATTQNTAEINSDLTDTMTTASQPSVDDPLTTPAGEQVTPSNDESALAQQVVNTIDETQTELATSINEAEPVEVAPETQAPVETLPTEVVEDVAIFTFSGDCWVNIYDATGERVAWGVKKTDYVMTIKGQAPFNVTLGKPELVTIEFAGQAIDMSRFNAGNIAKFTLPLEQAQ